MSTGSTSHIAVDDTGAEHPLVGIAFLLAATTIFPLQDVIIKMLSDNYAVHQVVFLRSVFAFPIVLLIARFEGQLWPLKIGDWRLQLLRALAAFCSYLVYYMALAAIGLAETVAIAFSTPIFVTLLAVFFLKERIGVFRCLAVLLGLVGVLVIVRPGTGVFEPAALLTLIAAMLYAVSIIATRKLGRRTNGSTMTIFTVGIYLVGGSILGVVFSTIDAQSPHPSLAFLFRGWTSLAPTDWLLIMVIGLTSALGFFCLSQAYRLSEASVVTPFEYTAMPWAVLWGWVFFSTLPDLATWIGLSLIIGAGLLILLRETVREKKVVRRRGLGVFRQR